MLLYLISKNINIYLFLYFYLYLFIYYTYYIVILKFVDIDDALYNRMLYGEYKSFKMKKKMINLLNTSTYSFPCIVNNNIQFDKANCVYIDF